MLPPTILLDIDGVFSPWTDLAPEGYVTHNIRANRGAGLISVFQKHFHPNHKDQLDRLVELGATLVWSTLWEADANDYAAPILGINPLRTLYFNRRRPDGTSALITTSIDAYKLAVIKDSFDDKHPLCWIDDDIAETAHDWANTRSGPTLLLKPDPTIGVLPLHFEAMENWVKEHTPVV